MTNTTNALSVGDRVVIQNRGDGWDGVTGKIIGVTSGDDYSVQYDDPETTPLGKGWTVGTWTGYLVKLSPETTNGLRAALAHDTSREYASHARSRVLPGWANDVLEAASEGEEVDVVEFRKAATQALSAAATRAGQSMGRRVWTREARHLIYWADAIIDNHLKGIPPYEGGPRSPRIHALEEEVTNLKQAASDERRRLVAEIDDLRDEVARARRSESTEVNRTAALIREKTDLEIQVEDLLKGRTSDFNTLQDLYREINEAHAALEYAFGLLRSEEDKSRLAGFRDGYAQRCNDVPTTEH